MRNKFQVGDLVKTWTGEIKYITEKKYRDHAIRTSKHVFEETWLYRFSDSIKWHPEYMLESKTACPSCGAIGWDWIVGCAECTLSPSDVRNDHTTDFFCCEG